jgi:hypothetical protein
MHPTILHAPRYVTPDQESNLIVIQYHSLSLLTLPSEKRAGLNDFNNTCEAYGGVSLPPYSIITNISENNVSKLLQVDVANYTSTEELNTAVFPSEELYEVARRTIDTWDDSEVTRASYEYAMYGFWGVVLFFAAIHRIVAFMQRYRIMLLSHTKHQKLNRLHPWA